VRHVSNVHTKPKVSTRQPLESDGVIKITRMLTIDRDSRHRTKVGPASAISVAHLRTKALSLANSRNTVRIWNTVLPQHDLDIDSWGI
jgi:hypothetical protein